MNGRDYTKLIYLNPGVAGSPDQISDSPGSFGEFSMNGARGRSNNYLLDGTDMNDGYRNDPAINEAGVFGDPSTILPIDAVAEVNVISNFEPEYGRNAGAVYRAVVCSTGGRVALPCAWAGARRAGVPLILWASLWAHPRSAPHLLSYIALRRLYRSADAVVTYGPHVSAYVRARGARNVHVAPQSVDNAFWSAPVSALPSDPRGPARRG